MLYKNGGPITKDKMLMCRRKMLSQSLRQFWYCAILELSHEILFAKILPTHFASNLQNFLVTKFL